MRNDYIKMSSLKKIVLVIVKVTSLIGVTHIYVGRLTIIGSDNGLSPCRHQAITWTNARILLIGPMGTNFSEILIEISKILFKKMHSKLSSGNWQPLCLGLNVLTPRDWPRYICVYKHLKHLKKCSITLQMDHREHIVMKLWWNYNDSHKRKCRWCPLCVKCVEQTNVKSHLLCYRHHTSNLIAIGSGSQCVLRKHVVWVK